MIRRTPRSTRADTLLPCTTLFRSQQTPSFTKVIAAYTRTHRSCRFFACHSPTPYRSGIRPEKLNEPHFNSCSGSPVIPPLVFDYLSRGLRTGLFYSFLDTTRLLLAVALLPVDRQRIVLGKGVSVRVDSGG